MRAWLTLADYAVTTPDHKLTIVGGGWSVTGPAPMASAVAALINVPWTETNRGIDVEFELVSQDGAKVTDQAGAQVKLAFRLEVGRPPGTPNGAEIGAPLTFNVAPLPLDPGQSYEWVMRINGKEDPAWKAAFLVRPLPPSGPAALPGL